MELQRKYTYEYKQQLISEYERIKQQDYTRYLERQKEDTNNDKKYK